MSLPLTSYESNVTSQSGEDGILDHILRRLGHHGKVAVEFGAGDGCALSNTWALEHSYGWHRWLFDGCARGAKNVHECYLTIDNINQVFDRCNVPETIDVLSIDVDGNDLWLWEALHRPARIVIIEYNTAVPEGLARAIKYNPNHRWDGTSYYGASLTALCNMARKKHLCLIHYTGLNAFFVDSVEAEAANIGVITPQWKYYHQHPKHSPDKTWVEVV